MSRSRRSGRSWVSDRARAVGPPLSRPAEELGSARSQTTPARGPEASPRRTRGPRRGSPASERRDARRSSEHLTRARGRLSDRLHDQGRHPPRPGAPRRALPRDIPARPPDAGFDGGRRPRARDVKTGAGFRIPADWPGHGEAGLEGIGISAFHWRPLPLQPEEPLDTVQQAVRRRLWSDGVSGWSFHARLRPRALLQRL